MSFESLGQLSNLGAWLGSLEASSEGSALAGPPKPNKDPMSKVSDFDLNKFSDLLGKLEASKKRQAAQKSGLSQREIFSQGLSSMMSNF